MENLCFKEWLLDEVRLKGLHRQFNKQFAGVPKYVRQDLYNSRIGHTMSSLNKSSSGSGTFGNGFVRTPHSAIPSDSVSRIFQKSGLHDLSWGRPEILKGKGGTDGVRPTDFTEETLDYFIRRRFGYEAIAGIPNDALRTQKQKELMQKRPAGQNETVIVVQTLNGYRLLEGWHRTMNYLLTGAPQDQIGAIKTGRMNYVDFSKWQPVRILAYIGRGPDVMRALAGTGDFDAEPNAF